jgi:hypothetical protein
MHYYVNGKALGSVTWCWGPDVKLHTHDFSRYCLVTWSVLHQLTSLALAFIVRRSMVSRKKTDSHVPTPES